jgi:pimeloyl-[acyl-carrier protein] synthase
MNKLRQQPELVPLAVEEFLRYQSPLQVTDRFVLEDLQLDGQELKKGERIAVIIGGANRDPSRFELPNILDIERQPNKHFAFGQGIHFCLGAPLARFEAKMAFEKLLSRLSDIALSSDVVEYRDSATFRGLHSLPLKFKAV